MSQSIKNRPTVAVLGAGLAGVSTALELARSGVATVLVDQDSRILNRAGLRNEGKIHLGLIYANEGSLDTAKLQLQGALTFRSTLARWIGDKVDKIPLSTPFTYLVSKSSLCTADELEAHYLEVQRLYEYQIEDDKSLDYLGQNPEMLYRRQASIPSHFLATGFDCSFETAEQAIDTEVMTSLLRTAVEENDLVQQVTGVRVMGVTRLGDRLRVEGSTSDGVWRREFDQVVNALWDGRIAVDFSFGLTPAPGWLYRLKYRVIVKLPKNLVRRPSATIVLGRYGDVVIRPDGSAYLSWYPVGLQGWSHDREPAEDWAPSCRGEPDAISALQIASETLSAIDTWYPGIGRSRVILVDAGVICAYGKTDVDDVGSTLHGRTRVGVISDNGYHSVDPGKLTTAPLFGRRVAEAVIGH